MKNKIVISYYCKQCSDTATSWRDETFELKPGKCSKHQVALTPYHAEDMLDDINNIMKDLPDDQ